MSDPERFGLFLASDARAQYAEDVLTALALPAGAALQLRYDDRYLSEELDRICRSGDVIGRRFVVAFMSAILGGRNYLLPVRFCRVTEAQALGGIWIFRVTVETYPLVDNWPEDPAALEALGRRLQQAIGDPGNPSSFTFATNECPFDVRTGDEAHCWRHIARRLSVIPAFGEERYFIKVGVPVQMESATPLRADPTGIFSLPEEKNYRLAVSYWAARQTADEHGELEASIWGEGADIVSPSRIPVKSRYDSYDVVIKSLSVNSPSLCRLDLGMHQGPTIASPLKMGAQLTFRISTSRRRVIARVGISALAALLLAVPSMLGSNTPLEARVAIAGLGAVALGITSSGVGTWGRK